MLVEEVQGEYVARYGGRDESPVDESLAVVVTRSKAAAVRDAAARMPTYVTLKDVKKRWGHGQEDVFPVTQWEKLWSDGQHQLSREIYGTVKVASSFVATESFREMGASFNPATLTVTVARSRTPAPSVTS